MTCLKARSSLATGRRSVVLTACGVFVLGQPRGRPPGPPGRRASRLGTGRAPGLTRPATSQRPAAPLPLFKALLSRLDCPATFGERASGQDCCCSARRAPPRAVPESQLRSRSPAVTGPGCDERIKAGEFSVVLHAVLQRRCPSFSGNPARCPLAAEVLPSRSEVVGQARRCAWDCEATSEPATPSRRRST
jgi:hypothetical protein